MQDEQKNEYFELTDEFEQSTLKDTMINMAQQKVLELTKENLLLSANVGYLSLIKEQYSNLLEDFNKSVEHIQEFDSIRDLETKGLHDDMQKNTVILEQMKTDHMNLINKVETGYKPRITELEQRIQELDVDKPKEKKETQGKVNGEPVEPEPAL
jgi:hypothetical protein